MKYSLSIVVPCYNESQSLPLFYDEIQTVLHNLNDVEVEIIFVNDGSKDQTLHILTEISLTDLRVKYISFSRNFGKEAAILAGLRASQGDYIVLMDADLQDPPRLLPEMINCICVQGYDSVATRRVSRKGEPPIRSFFARMFYKIINKISDADIVDGARDYRMMTREMVNSILELSEYHRFSKGIFSWVGYHTKWLEFENAERIAGESKWSFKKLFFYAIEGIVAFSTVPLRMSSIFGVLISILAVLTTIFVIIRKLLFGDSVAGWTSLMCVVLFIGGVQLLFMGIIGEYLAKTYMEVKRRPNYIIKETNTDVR